MSMAKEDVIGITVNGENVANFSIPAIGHKVKLDEYQFTHVGGIHEVSVALVEDYCGYVAKSEITVEILPVVTPEPLEMQKKRLKRVCQKKAAELVKIIHPTKPKDEVGPLIARVHERWAAMPGHHYQSDSRIGVPELEQKSVWLDGLISVARTERLNHAT